MTLVGSFTLNTGTRLCICGRWGVSRWGFLALLGEVLGCVFAGVGVGHAAVCWLYYCRRYCRHYYCRYVTLFLPFFGRFTAEASWLYSCELLGVLLQIVGCVTAGL